MLEKYTIEGIDLWLSTPVPNQAKWVGQEEVMEQLLACWLSLGENDLPLCPRLVGKPGLGKTTLAMAAAQTLGKEVYIYQCTMDTRPEDLLVTPVLSEHGKIRYHASPLVTAMIRGGVCILDEGNRMSEKSWASLAPLLDHRRYVESVIAGIKIPAHPEFRCTVTMNDDASTYELPDYIMSRVQPMIEIFSPSKEEEMAILEYHLPFAPKELLEKTADFLYQAQKLNIDASPRDGIQMIRYILKRQKQNPSESMEDLWDEALAKILGPEAFELDNLQEKREKLLQDEDKLQDLFELFGLGALAREILEKEEKEWEDMGASEIEDWGINDFDDEDFKPREKRRKKGKRKRKKEDKPGRDNPPSSDDLQDDD